MGGGAFFGLYMTRKGRGNRKAIVQPKKAVMASKARDIEGVDSGEFSHKRHVIRQTALLELIQIDLRYIKTVLQVGVTLWVIWTVLNGLIQEFM